MRRYQLRAAFLWAILALSGLGLLLAAFSLKSNLMPWAVVLFLVVCLAVQVLLYRTAGAYMRELVCQLSDLIDQLTQLREDPVFPPLEDTILSRLQQQVERLASIWAGLNRQAKRDRDEIQSLVSDLSHQLKTPVATLQIYGSLLSQPGQPALPGAAGEAIGPAVLGCPVCGPGLRRRAGIEGQRRSPGTDRRQSGASGTIGMAGSAALPGPGAVPP